MLGKNRLLKSIIGLLLIGLVFGLTTISEAKKPNPAIDNTVILCSGYFIDVTADPNTLPADGESTSSIVATVTTCGGSPVAGHKVRFSISPAGMGSFSGASPDGTVIDITDCQGKAEATYIAGALPGTATITATDISVCPYISDTVTVTLLEVDYIIVKPNTTSLLLGGEQQFTAEGWNNGPDNLPQTEDDIELAITPTWSFLDDQGNPIATGPASSTYTLKPPYTNTPGKYTLKATCGEIFGEAIVYIHREPAEIILRSSEKFVVAEEVVVKPVTNTATITATVLDEYGSPVEWCLILLDLSDPSLGSLSKTKIVTDSGGKAESMFKANTEERAIGFLTITSIVSALPTLTDEVEVELYRGPDLESFKWETYPEHPDGVVYVGDKLRLTGFTPLDPTDYLKEIKFEVILPDESKVLEKCHIKDLKMVKKYLEVEITQAGTYTFTCRLFGTHRVPKTFLHSPEGKPHPADGEKKSDEEESNVFEFKIGLPKEDKRFSFNEDKRPKCKIHCWGWVEGIPQIEWEKEIEWSCIWLKKEVKASGWIADLELRPMPAKNDEFGALYNIKGKYERGGLISEKKVERVYVFFAKDATNHPKKGPHGKTPNWFYYWRQTGAATGADPKYGGDKGTMAGQYIWPQKKPKQKEQIYIYAAASGSWEGVGGEELDGIDLFAAICRHELTHKWCYHNIQGKTDNDEFGGDWLPDDEEPTMKNYKGEWYGKRYGKDYPFDPTTRWTYFPILHYMNDQEVYAHDKNYQYHDQNKGIFNSVDWAYPGHQWKK